MKLKTSNKKNTTTNKTKQNKMGKPGIFVKSTSNPVVKLGSGSVHDRTTEANEKMDEKYRYWNENVSAIQVWPLSGEEGNEQLPPFPLRKIW